MLERLNEIILDLKARLDRQPTFGWAVVTSVSPLMIRYDGQTEPIAGTPDRLVSGLAVGDRVWVQRQHRRDIVLGRGGGTTLTRPELMGTIRRANGDGTGNWQALEDAGHTSIGIARCEHFATFLRVHFTFTAAKVLTFSATLDESLAASNAKVRLGASVGLSYADLYFYLDATGAIPQDPAIITTPGGNVWLSGNFLA